jgi:hypothetical protein
VSVIAIYWPISGWYREINDQLQQSARTNTDLNNLKNQGLSCRLPIVDPQKTEAPPLDGFPTARVYKIGVEVVKKIQQQSTALMTQAIADNKRAPLDPNALPTYRTGAARATFKDNYYLYLDYLKGKDMLNALPPPTPKDVAEEHAARWNEWLQKLPAVNNVRDPQAVSQLQADFNNDVVPALPASVAKARAEACTMYVSAGGLYVHPGIPPQGSSVSASLNDVWAAQIGCWIQTDICSAIAQTNKTLGRPVAGRITVPNACVKRLVRTNVMPAYITINGPVQFGSRGAMGDMGGPPSIGNNPGMLPAAQPKAVPTVVRSFHPAFTGRVSNEVYEVVHFSFTVDIEAANCRALLANLTNGRFVTVLSTSAIALDRGACQSAGLLYGSQPVVQMTVTAESVFFHDWTKDWMPAPVAAALEQQLQNKSTTGR